MTGPIPSPASIKVAKRGHELKVAFDDKEYDLGSLHNLLQQGLATWDSHEAGDLEVLAKRIRSAITDCISEKRVTELFRGVITDKQDAALYAVLKDTKQAERLACRGEAASIIGRVKLKIPPQEPVSNYDKWKQACERLDLIDSCKALTRICQIPDPKIAKEQFQKVCKDRYTKIAGTDLDFTYDPTSLCNQLFVDVATTLFPIQNMGELVRLLFPDVRNTFEPIAVNKKPSLGLCAIGDCLHTVACDPASAASLKGILVLGDTAIFSQDYADLQAKRLSSNFWDAMKMHAPGMIELLAAQNSEVRKVEDSYAPTQRVTPILKKCIENLAKAFSESSAYQRGSVTQATSGAQVALDYFERDWALFSSMHQSSLGKKIASILHEVKTGYASATGCVFIASHKLQRLLEDLSSEDTTLLNETRERPEQKATQSSMAPVITANPKILPPCYALQSTPSCNTETLLYHLLEMPFSTYRFLLSGLNLSQLAAVNWTSDLGQEARAAFTVALKEELEKKLLAPEASKQLRVMDYDYSSPLLLLEAARSDNLAAFEQLLQMYTPAELAKYRLWTLIYSLSNKPTLLCALISRILEGDESNKKALRKKMTRFEFNSFPSLFALAIEEGQPEHLQALLTLYKDEPKTVLGLFSFHRYSALAAALSSTNPEFLIRLFYFFKNDISALEKQITNVAHLHYKNIFEYNDNKRIPRIETLSKLLDKPQLLIAFLDNSQLEALLSMPSAKDHQYLLVSILNVLKHGPQPEIVKKVIASPSGPALAPTLIHHFVSNGSAQLLRAALACFEGDKKGLAKALLTQDKHGNTPLHLAKDSECVQLIFDALKTDTPTRIAILAMKNRKNQTPLYWMQKSFWLKSDS